MLKSHERTLKPRGEDGVPSYIGVWLATETQRHGGGYTKSSVIFIWKKQNRRVGPLSEARATPGGGKSRGSDGSPWQFQEEATWAKTVQYKVGATHMDCGSNRSIVRKGLWVVSVAVVYYAVRNAERV